MGAPERKAVDLEWARDLELNLKKIDLFA